jgi:hypothetical protein
VEVDGAFGGVGGEVGSGVPESDCHGFPPVEVAPGGYVP